MKVLFLDHDGVICLSQQWGSRDKKQRAASIDGINLPIREVPIEYRFDSFDKKAVAVLNSIIEETGCEIVVSSDWKKWATVQEMGLYYKNQGIIKKPIAFTKDLDDCTIDYNAMEQSEEWRLEQERSIEIKQFLLDHPDITHWVAVDDLNMAKEGPYCTTPFIHDWALDNFAYTPLSNEGIKQIGVKKAILKHLL
jgi:hypothetical protein